MFNKDFISHTILNESQFRVHTCNLSVFILSINLLQFYSKRTNYKSISCIIMICVWSACLRGNDNPYNQCKQMLLVLYGFSHIKLNYISQMIEQKIITHDYQIVQRGKQTSWIICWTRIYKPCCLGFIWPRFFRENYCTPVMWLSTSEEL